MLWVCPHFTDERLRFRKERLWEQSLSWMVVTDPDTGHSARKWPPSQSVAMRGLSRRAVGWDSEDISLTAEDMC